MTAEQVKDILKQAADLGFLQVLFTGGEPLLRPDFEELYLFTRQLGMKVLLFTNGRLITPQLADIFTRFPPLLEIEITVYGMHSQSYESVTRAQGSFAQFQRGVTLLLERNVPFIVKGALLPQNRHEMDEFETWAQQIPWLDRHPKYAMFYDLRHRRDDESKNRMIESLRVSAREGIAIYLRDAEHYRKWTKELAAKLLRPPGDRLFTCGACDGHSACVGAYGHAQPCMSLRAQELTVDIVGTETRSSLRATLERFTQLTNLQAKNPDYLWRCASCFLKGICEQCPAKSWIVNGTFDTPVEYLCDMTHTMARNLGWLDEGESGWKIKDWIKRIKP
jgi:radical SAM protein with 4Fe4S-binding SPASM domain